MALRDSGVAELLPSVEVAVFDEAHQLVEAGVQFLGTTLGSAQLIDFARDMLAAGLQQARGLLPWPELARGLRPRARATCASPPPAGSARCAASLKLRWAERSGDDGASSPALQQVGEACEAAARGARDGERARARLRPARRARAPARRPWRGGSPSRPQDGQMRWIDLTRAAGAAGRVAARHPRGAAASRWRGAPKAWIFTSATLGDDDRLSWFTERAGLEEATHAARRQPVRLRATRPRLRAARVSQARTSPGTRWRSRTRRRAARARSAAAPSC